MLEPFFFTTLVVGRDPSPPCYLERFKRPNWDTEGWRPAIFLHNSRRQLAVSRVNRERARLFLCITYYLLLLAFVGPTGPDQPSSAIVMQVRGALRARSRGSVRTHLPTSKKAPAGVWALYVKYVDTYVLAIPISTCLT